MSNDEKFECQNKNQAEQALDAKEEERLRDQLKAMCQGSNELPYKLDPEAVKSIAKRLYYLGVETGQISELTGIHQRQVQRMAKAGGWTRHLREEENKAIRGIIKSKKDRFESISRNILAVVDRQVKKILKEGDKLSERALRDLTSVLVDIDKIFRLDNGLATEIFKQTEITHESIMAAIAEIQRVDPAIDYSAPNETRSSDEPGPEILN